MDRCSTDVVRNAMADQQDSQDDRITEGKHVKKQFSDSTIQLKTFYMHFCLHKATSTGHITNLTQSAPVS